MCELFGATAKKPFRATELLDAFYHHSDAHPDGWGLAVFYKGGVSMEKEPVKASRSRYLHNRLTRDVVCTHLLAHIRRATIGRIEYSNCHPFVWDDVGGRTWTLIHNGTLFEPGPTSAFLHRQEGTTDSERLLLYIVSRMDAEYKTAGVPPDARRRFHILDQIILELSAGNKLNLLLYDGAYLYVHTNCPDTLFQRQDENKTLFATQPMVLDNWSPVPRNQLLVYRDGKRVWSGTVHCNDFREEEHDMTSLHSVFAEL